MHIQPIDNATDFEPYVVGMDPGAAQHHLDDAALAGRGADGDTFDDIWGSEPSSPTLSASDAIHPAAAENARGVASHAHPSDMRRLQGEHSTAGYREGLTEAKNTSIQAGFDEGFGLGAALGSQAGQILGLLEGIANAIKTTQAEDSPARGEAERTLSEAKAELRVETLFTPEYWNTDGTWKYNVKGRQGGEGSGTDDDAEVLFSDVAEAHPLVSKWSKVVEEQVQKWAIDRNVFADVGDEERQAVQDKSVTAQTPQQTKKPLDW